LSLSQSAYYFALLPAQNIFIPIDHNLPMIRVVGQALLFQTSTRKAIPRRCLDNLRRKPFQNLSIGTKRKSSSKNRSSENPPSSIKDAPKSHENLKWTEKEEAPKWMQKMAPYKGGTKLPNKLEGTIISIVTVLGFYSWFVDPGSFLVDSKSNNDISASAAPSIDETR